MTRSRLSGPEDRIVDRASVPRDVAARPDVDRHSNVAVILVIPARCRGSRSTSCLPRCVIRRRQTQTCDKLALPVHRQSLSVENSSSSDGWPGKRRISGPFQHGPSRGSGISLTALPQSGLRRQSRSNRRDVAGRLISQSTRELPRHRLETNCHLSPS